MSNNFKSASVCVCIGVCVCVCVCVSMYLCKSVCKCECLRVRVGVKNEQLISFLCGLCFNVLYCATSLRIVKTKK